MKDVALGLVVALPAVLACVARGAHGQHFEASQRQALPVGETGTTRSALVDLDGDGALDYFAGGADYFRNDGRGRFNAVPLPPAVGGLRAIGDFDGDGDDDLLTTNAVIENRGAAGLFAWPSSIQDFVIATGDLNGDGRTDLVFVGGVAFATSIHTFSSVTVPAWSWFGTSATVADIDGDGDRDIVWGASRMTISGITIPGFEYVSRNDGSGVFTNTSPFPNTPDDVTDATIAFDIDGDGDVDCGFLSGTWQLWRNQGGGSFAPWGPNPFGRGRCSFTTSISMATSTWSGPTCGSRTPAQGRSSVTRCRPRLPRCTRSAMWTATWISICCTAATRAASAPLRPNRACC